MNVMPRAPAKPKALIPRAPAKPRKKVKIALKGGGETLKFPSLPERIDVRMETVERSYDVIDIGEVIVPKGNEPIEISWEGRLFGESRKNNKSIFATKYMDPIEVIELLEQWRSTGTVLRLIASNTFINYQVIITRLEATPLGGYGDIEYEIRFKEYKKLTIEKIEKKKKTDKKDKKQKNRNEKDDKNKTMIVTAGSGLHLRDKPNGNIIDLMPYGTKVKTDGKSEGNWIHVCYHDKWGYAYSAYLKKADGDGGKHGGKDHGGDGGHGGHGGKKGGGHGHR